jgi:hypothetical protein
VIVVRRAPCVAEPGAPSNLTSVSHTAGTTLLAWGAAPGDPNSYVVDAGRAPGQTGLVPGLSTVITGILTAPQTSLTATGLASGTYYIRVRARNACGISSPSNEIGVTVP